MTLSFHWKASREEGHGSETGLLKGEGVWFCQFLSWEWFNLSLARRGDGCDFNNTREEIA